MRCEKCNVDIAGSHKICPLCQSDTIGQPNDAEEVFPFIPFHIKTSKRFVRVMAFITIVNAIICVAVNYLFHSDGWWSLFVIGGSVSFWLAFAVIIRKMGNIPKTIVWQVVLISAISVIWDLATGFRGWSIDFVVPISCICAMVAMAVTARIIKMQITDYMFYLIIDLVLGIASLVLLLCGVLNVIVPSLICVVASVIFLSALILFEGKALRAEIQRRFHL